MIAVAYSFGSLLFVLAVGAVAFGLRAYLNSKRTEKLEAVAAQLKLEFFPKDGPIELEQLAGFYLITQGVSPRFRNVMHGNAQGVDVTVFDFRYSTGKSSFTTTVARFRTADLALPAFSLRPEGIAAKIGKAFGYQDIDIRSHPRFSETFLLRGAEEQAIRSLFDDELVGGFEQMKGISVEVSGNQLIFYREMESVPPPEIAAFFKEALGVYLRLKDAEERRAT